MVNKFTFKNLQVGGSKTSRCPLSGPLLDSEFSVLSTVIAVRWFLKSSARKWLLEGAFRGCLSFPLQIFTRKFADVKKTFLDVFFCPLVGFVLRPRGEEELPQKRLMLLWPPTINWVCFHNLYVQQLEISS